ncbi:MAG: hypothetical protein ABI743_14790 [bacterium]
MTNRLLAILLLCVVCALPAVADPAPTTAAPDPWDAIPIPDSQTLMAIQSTMVMEPGKHGATDIRARATDDAVQLLVTVGPSGDALMLMLQTQGPQELRFTHATLKAPKAGATFTVPAKDVLGTSLQESTGKITWYESWSTGVDLGDPVASDVLAPVYQIKIDKLWSLLSSESLQIEFQGKATTRKIEVPKDVILRERGILQWYAAVRKGVVKI